MVCIGLLRAIAHLSTLPHLPLVVGPSVHVEGSDKVLLVWFRASYTGLWVLGVTQLAWLPCPGAPNSPK